MNVAKWLLVLVAAAAVALCAVEAMPTGTPFSMRFRSAVRARAQETVGVGSTLEAILIAAVKDADEKGLGSLKDNKQVLALKYMFDNSNALPAKQDLESIVSRHGLGQHGIDNAQVEWMRHLKKSFTNRQPFPKVLVRGGGPAGLAAALYAAQHCSKVHVREKYSRYFRQHVVSTWSRKKFKAPLHNAPNTEVEPHGMEDLFTLIGIGAAHRQSATYQAFEKAIYMKYVAPIPPAIPEGRMIMVSDLEKLLAVVAHVVGVEFTFGDLAAKDGNRPGKVTEVNTLVKARGKSPWALGDGAKCTYTAGAADYVHADEDQLGITPGADYDVVIGAEGAKSATRRALLPGSAFVPPLVYTATGNNNQIPGTLNPEVPDVSDALRSGGGLVTAGFVTVSAVADANRCDGVRPNTGGKNGLAAKPYCKKFANLAGKKGSQIEIFFRQGAGHAVKRAFSADCGFNYNLASATAPTNDDASKLALMHAILKGGLKADADAEATFGEVTEFKLWENTLRMSVKKADVDNVRPAAYVGRLEPYLMLAIIGDAVRDALPDGGMGVNDGHHMASMLGEELRRMAKAYADHEKPVRIARKKLEDAKALLAKDEQISDKEPLPAMTNGKMTANKQTKLAEFNTRRREARERVPAAKTKVVELTNALATANREQKVAWREAAKDAIALGSNFIDQLSAHETNVVRALHYKMSGLLGIAPPSKNMLQITAYDKLVLNNISNNDPTKSTQLTLNA